MAKYSTPRIRPVRGGVMMRDLQKKAAYLYYYGGGGQAPVDPRWWLADGLIPESVNYTVYDPLAAETLVDSYVNLVDPGTRDATPGVAPSHAQGTGWTFNGTTQYLKTSNNTKKAQTTVVWVEDAGGIYVTGSSTTSSRVCTIRPVSGTNTRFSRAGTTQNITGQTVGGVLGITELRGFKNGVKGSGDLGAFPASQGVEYYIGCDNAGGTPGNYFSGRVLRYAIYTFNLSDEQMDAVAKAMTNYLQPAANSYQNKVLALSPMCYYPCTQRIGSQVFDISGNNAHSEAFSLQIGQDGLKGFSFGNNGTATSGVRSVGNWPSRTGIDMDEFSFSCLLKVNTDESNQIRVVNIFTGTASEYFACEIRGGSNVGLFVRENGSDQVDQLLTTINDGQWHHIVAYNSLSQGVIGVYKDGQKFELSKTTDGFSNKTPDALFPQSGQDMSGNIQHIAYFDHALSQSEVNSLLP